MSIEGHLLTSNGRIKRLNEANSKCKSPFNQETYLMLAILRCFKIKFFVTINTKNLGFGMLVVTKIAIQIRTVVRRFMRVSRMDIFSFFRKLCRIAMTGGTLFNSQRLGSFCLTMALNTAYFCQAVKMASRQFSRQASTLF